MKEIKVTLSNIGQTIVMSCLQIVHFGRVKVNSYYTFSKKPTGTNYTIKDIEPILLKNCPVQLTIDNKVVWDDKYNDCDDYDTVIATYANYEVLELWLSTVDHHSLVKITTRENNNGT